LQHSCRTNPDDELENAEFLGMNVYLHCDGSVTDPDNLLGFEAMLADFQTYETTVPVMVCTNFTCAIISNTIFSN